MVGESTRHVGVGTIVVSIAVFQAVDPRWLLGQRTLLYSPLSFATHLTPTPEYEDSSSTFHLPCIFLNFVFSLRHSGNVQQPEYTVSFSISSGIPWISCLVGCCIYRPILHLISLHFNLLQMIDYGVPIRTKYSLNSVESGSS